METKNAVISNTTITREDHGLLSAWLTLDYGGVGQGFGGYALYLPESFSHHEKASGYAGHFIFRVLEIAGVERWEDLKGKTIRVEAGPGQVYAIGHIVKNDWFYPERDFREIKKAHETKAAH